MGLIDTIGGRRTYFDANIFIYLFEEPAGSGPALRELARSLDQGLFAAATSELTLAEALVEPIRGAPSYSPIYQQYIRTRAFFEVVPVTRALLIEAARLRASTTLKLPDAIHLATAMQSGCDIFLTNDTRIKTVPGIEILQLSDAIV